MNDPTPFRFDLLNDLGAMKDIMVHLGVSAARCAGTVIVMPLFKRTELGQSLLFALSISFALPIFVGLAPEIRALPIDNMLFLTGLVMKEAAIGMLIGLLFGIPFWAIQAAGEFVDHQRTIGQSGISDPTTGEQGSVLSAIFGLIAITIFAVEGGIALLISTIYESYGIWPVDRFLPSFSAQMLGEITRLLGEILLLGLLIAAPVVFLFLLSDFATMAIGRTNVRVQLVSLLPLVKNVMFCVFILLYLEFLVGYMADGIRTTGLVSRTLGAFVGGPANE